MGVNLTSVVLFPTPPFGFGLVRLFDVAQAPFNKKNRRPFVWRSRPQNGCKDRIFALKFGQQFKTLYRLACLDRTSPGQAKMSSLKVKSVRNRGWAHNPMVLGSNPSPAT